MRILVTGGAGYIGSHACVELLRCGHKVLVLDNLSNARPGTIEAIGAAAGAAVDFVRGDVRDKDMVAALLTACRIDAVMHFAASKSAPDSCRQPLEYFDNNVGGTIGLLQAMRRSGVRHLVFSSSAAVYGEGSADPIPESAPLRPVHPYGRSKWICEQILADAEAAHAELRVASLRYFNPAGAHASGLLGDEPAGEAGNLFRQLCKVASGQCDALPVYGSDYATADGTGVRDYLHVGDVALAHARALDYITAQARGVTLNLGRGQGLSVLDVVRAFERASGCDIPLAFRPRRPGDVASSVADPARARALLGWQAGHGVGRICEDAWRWQQRQLQARSGCAA